MDKNNYQIGSLSYTRSSLVKLFGILLWGDFCLNLIEVIMPNVLPILFMKEGISATLISIATTSFPSIVMVFFNPVIMTWSDRYRSLWGRRIPFIAAGIPVKAISLLGICFYSEIASFLVNLTRGGIDRVTASTVVLFVFIFLCYMGKTFTMFPYLALINDTVPRKVIGRFSTLFRVASTVAAVFFNFWILPHLDSNFRSVFIVVTVVFVISYSLMCLRVKEGVYPEVKKSDREAEKTFGNGVEKIKNYFRDFFNHRLYVWMSLDASFSLIGNAALPFYILMHQNLGFSLKEIGIINGSATAVMIPSFFLAGFFMDKVNCVKVFFYGRVLQSLLAFLLLTYLFIDMGGKTAFVVALSLNIALQVVTAVMLVTYFPMQMRLFPRDSYGHFSSALSVLVGVLGIVAGPLIGLGLDGLRKMNLEMGDGVYRYAPLWMGVFYACASFSQYKVHQEVYVICGDDLDQFVPPGTEKPVGGGI